MFRCFNLLILLFYFVHHSGTGSLGTSGSVTGEKGGNITLTCEFEASEILDISLSSRSQDIPVRQEKNSSGRIFRKGDCDIVIKDLVFRDAGTYILRVYYHNDQPKNRTYHLHIHDEITVKKGKPLKLDVLLSNADKVETNSSGVWKEIWNRISRVQDDHLSDSDGNLTIKEFMKHDEGTYRVLDYEGQTLITVTIIESSTESKENLNNTDKDKTDDTQQHKNSIVPVFLGILVPLAVIVIAVIIWRCWHRVYTRVSVQSNPEPQVELPNFNDLD